MKKMRRFFFLISDIRPPFVESNLDNKEIMRGIFFYSSSDKMKKASVGDWHGLANLNGSFIPDENGGRLLQPSPLMQ